MVKSGRYRFSAKVLIGTALLYFLFSLIMLARLSFPSTKDGIGYLQEGQSLLLTDPERASQLFDKATASFEESSANLKQASLLTKATAIIPPFRWQVRLLQAMHSLASAGEQASTLARDFPELLPAGNDADLSTMLIYSSTNYHDWHQSHSEEIAQLHSSLTDAQQNLDAIPAWIMLGQSQELNTLSQQISQANASVNIVNDISQAAFASANLEPRYYVLFFNNANELASQPSTRTYAVTTFGPSGITAIDFPMDAITLPASLAPFFNEAGPQLAAAASQATGKHIDGVITLDASLWKDLLSLTSNQNIDQTIASTYANNSFSQIVPALITALGREATALPVVLPLLTKNTRDKSIQFWSADEPLEELINSHAPADIPDPLHPWIKLSGTNGLASLDSDQPLFKQEVHYTVTLNEPSASTPIDITLPSNATILTTPVGAEIEETTAYIKLKVSSSEPIILEFSMPKRPGTTPALAYLVAAGSEGQSLRHNGKTIPVTGNLLLTK